MTLGVGGSTEKQALATLFNMTKDVQPIDLAEYQQRLSKAQRLMKQAGLGAVYLNAGTNLYYFTGMQWYASERLVGAILPAEGKVQYIAPYFEISTLKGFMRVEGEVNGWQEDESPYDLVVNTLKKMDLAGAKVGIDESTSFFISDGLRLAGPDFDFVSAKAITAGCRAQKSAAELALLQRAKDMTLEVHKAVASILRPGITTEQVTAFINLAHQKVGAARSSFCIVLFGVD
jgi:Xaa-Pro dipeptidase